MTCRLSRRFRNPKISGVYRRVAVGQQNLAILTILAGTLIRIPQLGFVLGDSNDFRKTQTAFVARKFFREGIDLFSYPLPVFGSAQGVHYEMPIFQAGAALIQHLGVSEDASGQLLSLIMFQLASVLTWLLCKRWFDAKVALISVVLLQFIPYSMEWASAYLIESTALAFSLTAVLLIDNWTRHQRVLSLICATLFASLAFLTKITTPVGWLLGATLYLFLSAPRNDLLSRRLMAAWPALLVSALGLLAGLGWTSFADSVKEKHPITTFLTSSSLSSWNFGTLQQRLDPYIYIVFGARTWLEIMGFTFLIVPVVAIRHVRDKSLDSLVSPLAIAAAVVFGPLVFFNIFQHDYYFLAILPGMTILAAWAITEFSRLFFPNQPRCGVIWMSVLLLLTLWTSFWGARDLHSAFVSPKQYQLATIIRENTEPNSRLLMVGCDWNPTLLYYSDREGLMIPDWYIKGDYFRTGFMGPKWGDWKDRMKTLWEVENIHDYNYLVTCDSQMRDLENLETIKYQTVVDDFIYRIEKS